MLSHEASIIASKERAEMKMIEFFIPTKLSLTALDIQSQSVERWQWSAARAVTAEPVRCSAWLGIAVEPVRFRR
jgi:hypothetical protein